MTRLQLFITEKVPRGLRGELTRWMLELKPGVFVGTISTLVGEKLWSSISEKMKEGGAIWIRTTNTEQKFEIKGCGEYNRFIRDFDGLQLITVPQKYLHDIEESNPNPTINPENQNTILESPDTLIALVKDALEYVLEILNGKIPNPFNAVPQDDSKPKNKKQDDSKSKSNDHTNPQQSASTTTEKSITKNVALAIPHPDWDYSGISENFILRQVNYHIENGKLLSIYSGKSGYWEFSPDKIWNADWNLDIEQNSRLFLEYLNKIPRLILKDTFTGIIVALDIETTNYLPKAFEGFINIIGLAILTIPPDDSSQITLNFVQIFNMTRKKNLVPELITQVYPFFKDAEKLLVFNQDFDIKILSRIIEENALDVKFPSMIIDLQKDYPSLRSLEEKLENKSLFFRKSTAKGKYNEYYAQFKGEGKIGMNKQIDPIGLYNLMDCLSPLVMYVTSLIDHIIATQDRS